eukprot:2707179-Amphidinium_carterae.1
MAMAYCVVHEAEFDLFRTARWGKTLMTCGLKVVTSHTVKWSWQRMDQDNLTVLVTYLRTD